VRWASQALDVVRRWVWNLLRRLGMAGQAKQLKGCRYALWKNPEDLTDRQASKLAWIARQQPALPGLPATVRVWAIVMAGRSGAGWWVGC
jgi:transposase